MTDLPELLVDGVTGCYTHFEATTVFAVHAEGGTPENVFTILVAEERPNEAPAPYQYLGPRIRLKSLDWVFGVVRYVCPIADLLPQLSLLDTNRKFRASGDDLHFGEVAKLPGRFVQPDSTTSIPLNRVLKNNFWNGSHVFEWSDSNKTAFDALYAEPALIQELGEKVSALVPINLAALSDRIGNLLVQLPVTSVLCKFQPQRNGECVVKTAWHPGVTPRPLRASSQFEFDGFVSGFGSAKIDGLETRIKTGLTRGPHRGFLWDEGENLLLAAEGPTSFIETIAFNLRPVGIGDPRTLTYRAADGAEADVRIPVNMGSMPTVIGDQTGDDTGGRTRARMFRERESALIQAGSFKQYKPEHGQSLRKDALDDLRKLLNQFGETGAWLWDPYLSAYDVLETLLYSRNSGADLRALTAAKEPPTDVSKVESALPTVATAELTAKESFVIRQREILNNVKSNWRGLKLEFRARVGQAGWAFHDRFLICPQREGAARAWTLGTSVNSLGSEHHVIQEVEDGQLIANAFADLWDQLNEPDYLIWKKP